MGLVYEKEKEGSFECRFLVFSAAFIEKPFPILSSGWPY
jgi:hypothetical protein